MENQNTAGKSLSKQDANFIPTDNAVAAITTLQRAGKLDLQTAIKGRQLSYYRRNNGEVDVVKTLAALVLSIADSYNLKEKSTIDEKQSWEIAGAILKEFWYLKLAELFLFAEKAKNGDYGKVYDRLDRAVLFEWLRAYNEIREDHLFAEMQGRNETDDTPEIDEETKRINQEKADKALAILAERLKLTSPVGNSLKEKLTDPKFRKAAFDYEQSPEQKAIREHNQKIDQKIQSNA